VKIIEKRSLESLVGSASSPRSYPMVLSGRALRTFDKLDLDLPSTREPYYGITFVPTGMQMRFSGALPCWVGALRPLGAWRHGQVQLVLLLIIMLYYML
jgi:hypothetical protein